MILQNSFLWFIIWHPDLFLFENDFFSLRWYSFLFALGFIVGRYIVVRSYKLENGYDLTVDKQMFYMVAGTLFGSRMGHVIFYEPEILKTNFFKLFYFWESGLASHGAAIGILLGMAVYSYKLRFSGFSLRFIDRLRRGYSYYQVMDRMVIAIALGCAFIRIGNFFNSEIIGKPTESNYGVVFTQPIEKKIKSQLPFVKYVNFTSGDEYYELGKPILQTSIVFENNLYMEDRIRNSVEKRLKYILPNKISSYTNVINPYQGSLNYSFHRTKDKFELRFKSLGVNRHPTQLYEAVNYLLKSGNIVENPILDQVGAISCGICSNQEIIDLDYAEDSKAETDGNFVMTANNGIVEIQTTAEEKPFNKKQFLRLCELAENGTKEIFKIQRNALNLD